MSRSIRYLVVGVCALLAATGGLHAQTTTGRLIGSVTDEGGAVLPGVTVTISSDALIGGARTEVTDLNGEFAFIGLAPGYYAVRASLSGFPTQERTDVKVRLGGAASLDIEMPSGTFAGEIEVIAETPVVDPTQVNTQQIFDRSYLKNAAIGSNNRGYQYIMFQTSGVGQNDFDPAGGGGSNPSVFGSTVADNAYYMDGIDTTDPTVSTWGADIHFDAIQEIQFQTGGFEAQYGRATGGVVNLVTKSGGNQFSGTFDLRYRDDSFQESGDHYDASTLQSKQQLYGATLGGPVLRDRVWFFLSYEWIETQFTPIGAPVSRDWMGDHRLAKLTWQADPAWRVVAKYQADPAEIDNVDADPDTAPEATYHQDQGGSIYSFEVNGVLSDALLFNIAGATNRGYLDSYPQTGDLAAIAHENLDTSYHWSSNNNQQYGDRDRDDLVTNLTWFVDDLGGSHEFKGGLEYATYTDTSSNCATGTPGGITCQTGTSGFEFLDQEYGGHYPYLLLEYENASPATFEGLLYTAYLQDAWRPSANLTLKLGVRYDTVAWDNNEGTGVADFTKVQPRIGAAWDITGDAHNVLRANWGRFMHPANSSLPGFVDTTGTATYRYLSCSGIGNLYWGLGLTSPEECQAFSDSMGWTWIADPDGWDSLGWFNRGPADTYGAGIPDQIDPDLGPTYADELILSFERALWDRTSVELSYINKKTADIFEDTCNGNLPTPSVDAECDYFVVANLPPLKREYEGLMVRFETRSLDWLTLLASYTYSESKGSADSRWNFLGEWDVYPWHWENRYGYLGDHRRHRVKLNGFAILPYDFTIGFDAFWSSAFRYTPRADQTDYPEMPPWGEYFVEPRGSGEAYDNYQLDLQISKGFTVGSKLRLEVIGSVFNVLSSEQPIEVCEQISGCFGTADLGDPIDWQNPRLYEVGFRVEF